MISKDMILVITSLCDKWNVLVKKIVMNKEVETLIGVTRDQRSLLI